MNKTIIFKKAICLFMMLTIYLSLNAGDVYAYYDVFPGRFDTGKLTYGVLASSNESYAKTAVSQWNNISSKVKITRYTGKNQNDAKLKLCFNKIAAPTKGSLGVTFLQRKSGSIYQPVSSSDIWTSATCIQYTNSNATTKKQKLKTCVHEIGHALSLAHPTPGPAVAPSIMEQGIRDDYHLYERDKKSLIYKFGK